MNPRIIRTKRSYISNLLSAREGKKYRSSAKVGVMMAAIVLMSLIALALTTGKARAVNLAAIPPDIQQSMSCYDYGGNCGPACTSSGIPVYEKNESWIYATNGSPANDGTNAANPFIVSPGGQISLSIINLIYLCYPATASGLGFPNDSTVLTGNGNYNTPLTRVAGTYVTKEIQFLFGTGSATTGSLSGWSGANPQLVDFQPSTRYWFPGASNTTAIYTAPASLTSSPTAVTVSVPIYSANWFVEGSNNIYQCNIGGGYIPAGQYGPPDSGCPVYFANYTFYIEAPPSAPSTTRGDITVANCSQIGGFAESDPYPVNTLDPYPPTDVNIYVNGPAGSGAPGARYSASDYRFDVLYHSYNIIPATDPFISTYYNSGNAFTIYVYILGLNGAPDYFAGSATIGPCVSRPPPPSISIKPDCSAEDVIINASDAMPGVSLSVTYSSNNGGPSGSGNGNPFSKTISMNGYDSTQAYTFNATATASNGAGSQSNSFSATYGPCDKSPPVLTLVPTCTSPDNTVAIKLQDSDNTKTTAAVTYSISPGGSSQTVNVRTNGTVYKIDMSGFDQLQSYTISASTNGVQISGAAGNRPVSARATYGPCFKPVCGAIGVNPAVVEPSQSYSYSITLGFAAYGPAPDNGSPPPTNISQAVLVVQLSDGSTIGNFAPPSTSANTGSKIAPSTPNTYTISYIFTDGSQSISCSGGPGSGPIVGYKPFIQVKGGDISVGGGFAPSCTMQANPAAGAIGWNQNNAPTYSGAGDQFAVYALGPIYGFATSQGGSTPPGGLSFANSNGLYLVNPPDQFGGGLAKTACASDFYAAAPTAAPPGSSPTSLSVPTATTSPALSYSYTSGGTLTLNPAGAVNIPNGQFVTIYVEGGDVHINNNITLGSAPYSSVTDIPSFRLVVEGGNIIIAPGVSELDGTYIAEPDGSGNGGIITTCNYITTTADSACFDNTAAQTLTVKGSFVAKSVIFARSNNDANGTVPAETFIFSPAEWLSGTGSSSVVPNKYDSITSLPPVL